MHARIAGAVQSTGSSFKGLFARAMTTLSQLKRSEVAEAMIATWCIEFLRVRRFGGFHVVEIVVISVLMLGVKTIITEAGRRRGNAKTKTYPMSGRGTYMEPVEFDRYTAGTHNRPRSSRFNRGHFYR